ncbi:hypothetical protein DVH05_008378 [Phytophthora capsici]|nr:hypothetical protein DVH05_008378 [Phytophthora capsici]
MAKINKEVETIVKETSAKWKLDPSSWHVLKSLPGGTRQAPHKDFPTYETARAVLQEDWVQASVIVSLQPNTRFIVFPRCLGGPVEADDAEILELDVGEILFFRGDLVHAGADFDEENVRLFCYILVKGIQREDNATEAAVFASFICKYCLQECISKRSLANHIRYCPEKDENTKPAKRARQDEEIQCPHCPRVYTKRNSYNRHMKRNHSKGGDSYGNNHADSEYDEGNNEGSENKDENGEGEDVGEDSEVSEDSEASEDSDASEDMSDESKFSDSE